LTVRETRISAGCASAAMWPVMRIEVPVMSSPVRSTSPV
jgi:hypothetical protein